MRLTHLTNKGSAKMVDVGSKRQTKRKAIVCAKVLMKPSTLAAILKERVKKGNVLETARLAGIMAAKDTHKLIPLCHPINITHIKIVIKTKQPKSIKDFKGIVEIKATVQGYDRTGFEMEAMVATTSAALTVYDMCKAVDRGIQITDIKLMEKSGGKSGKYIGK